MFMKLATIWGVAFIVCFGFVKLTAFGPIIYTISAEYGWGVHSGDLFVLIPLMVAGMLTVQVVMKHSKKAS